MRQDIKKLWVNALRSKLYRKIKFSLKTGPCDMCVMGVLCDLGVKAGVCSEVYVNNDYKFGEKKNFCETPKEILTWAELNCTPRMKYLNGTQSIVSLNDQQNLSFEELAELIEAQL